MARFALIVSKNNPKETASRIKSVRARSAPSFTLFGPADYFNNRQLAIIEEQLQP
jgi:hypothetical protein